MLWVPPVTGLFVPPSLPDTQQSVYFECLQFIVDRGAGLNNILTVAQVHHYYPLPGTTSASSFVFAAPSLPNAIRPFSQNPLLALTESGVKALPGHMFVLHVWSYEAIGMVANVLAKQNVATSPEWRGELRYPYLGNMPMPEFVVIVVPNSQMIEKSFLGPLDRLVFSGSPRFQVAKRTLESRLDELDQSQPELADRVRQAFGAQHTTLHDLQVLMRDVDAALHVWAVLAECPLSEAMEAMVCDA